MHTGAHKIRVWLFACFKKIYFHAIKQLDLIKQHLKLVSPRKIKISDKHYLLLFLNQVFVAKLYRQGARTTFGQ